MTGFTIRIEGVEIVRQGLELVKTEVPRMGRLRIFRTVQGAIRTLKVYPPPPPQSRYVRTGRLGRSWRLTKLKETTYEISNAARARGIIYPRYVLGDGAGKKQAWMHIGRWRLFRVVVEEAVDQMWLDWQQDIDDLIRRVF